MSRNFTYLEAAYTDACASEYPLCDSGVNVFEDGTHHLIDRLHLDRTATEELLETHGTDPKFFRHSLIQIMPHGTLGKPTALGGFNPWPVSFCEQVYFPRIKIGIDAENPDVDAINGTFRHELGHLANDLRSASYNNERLMTSLKLGGTALASYVALAAEGTASTAPYLAFTAYSGLVLAGLADKLMYSSSITEFRANRFARQTKDFSPFSLQ